MGVGIPLTLLTCGSDIAAVVTIFNVLSYDAVLGRDSNQSTPGRRVHALRFKRQWVLHVLFFNKNLY